MSKLNESTKEAFHKGYRVNNNGAVVSPYGKKLFCSTSTCGYKKFTIRNINGKRVTVMAHKLMAYQKFGDSIFNKNVVVRHLDGNSSNNKPDNILIGSLSDNSLDIPEDMRKKTAKYASSFLIKHNAVKIKRDRDKGMTYTELMLKYGISSKGTVSYIINNR